MKHFGRKLYHAAGGMALLSSYYLMGRERAMILYAALLGTVMLLEAVRLTMPAFNAYVYDHFSGFIRPDERERLTGTAPYILGVAMAFLFYRPESAAAAVCFLAFGDVAATTVGERWGKTKIGAKSLEGTASFLGIAVAAGFLLSAAGIRLDIDTIIAGAVTAAVVELLPLPVNDNLLIPLASGGVMDLLMRLSGTR